MDSDVPSRVLDLNAVIAEVVGLLRLVAGARPILQTQLDPKLGRIKAVPAPMDWLFVNLVTNAYNANPAGSEFIIATSNVDLDPAGARELNVPPGAYVRVDLIVAGGRVDAAEKAREIVQHAGGGISVPGTGENGNTISVFWPRV